MKTAFEIMQSAFRRMAYAFVFMFGCFLLMTVNFLHTFSSLQDARKQLASKLECPALTPIAVNGPKNEACIAWLFNANMKEVKRRVCQ